MHAPILRLVILYFRIENHKVAPTLNLVMFVLNLAGTDITVRFKVFCGVIFEISIDIQHPKTHLPYCNVAYYTVVYATILNFFFAFVSS